MNATMTPKASRLNLHLLQRGIATLDGKFIVLSAAHAKEDIALALEALGNSL